MKDQSTGNNRYLVIGDLHFGEKSNSEKFNKQIISFLEWSVEYAKENNINKVIQLGDWFHSRHKIDVSTLNYGVQGARILSNHFGKDNVYVDLGNHDIHHLHRLDINSVQPTMSDLVTVIDKTTNIGDGIVITPWIIDEEQWESVVELSNKKENRFLMAHLELNGFYVTDNYKMEHGYSHRELDNYDVVFTGHYHSMQTKDNILYTGTPYPITMSEANEDHGVFVFEPDADLIELVVYEGVRVVSIPYDEIETLEKYDPENTSVRIEFPDDLEDETLIREYQETLHDLNFSEVKVKYTPKKVQELIDSDEEIDEVENIDQAVLEFIKSSSIVDGIDKTILEKYYKKALEGNE